MFVSKIVLIAVCCKISLAAVVTEDGDCAALPKKEVPLGEHAMLQLTVPKSKSEATPHVLTEAEIDNWVPTGTQTATEPGVETATEPGVETAGSTVNQQMMTANAEAGVLASTQGVAAAEVPLSQQQSGGVSRATTLSADQSTKDVIEASTLAKMPLTDTAYATTLSKTPAQESGELSTATVLAKSSAQEAEDVNGATTLTKSSSQEAEYVPATLTKNSTQEAVDETEAMTFSKMSAQEIEDEDSAEATTLSKMPAQDQATYASGSQSDGSISEKTVSSSGSQYSTDSTSSQTSGNLMRKQYASEEPAAEQACDWECYLDRYPDLVSVVGLDVAAAERHWEDTGKSEGRDCSCVGAHVAKAVDSTEEEGAADTVNSTGNQFNTIQDSSATAVNATDALTSLQNMTATAKDSAGELTSDQNMLATAKDSDGELTSNQNMVATARDSATAVVGNELTSGEDSAALAKDSTAAVTEASTGTDAKEAFKESLMDLATRCNPMSEEGLAALKAEISSNEEDRDKYEKKMLEAKGEYPASAGHVSIMKYLRERVLEPGWSVLELGAGAGGMLRFVEDEYENSIGAFDALVGIDLVPGWVKFAQEHFTDIHMYEGDITEFSLPEPYASKTFDFTMLNDVIEHVQSSRYGCLFSQLDRVTHPGSIVYMHTPSPLAQLEDRKLANEEGKQFLENVVPESFVSTAMAMHGFELVAFEHDMDTICGGEGHDIPRQIRGARCYHNGWPKYTHNVYRKAADDAVLRVS